MDYTVGNAVALRQATGEVVEPSEVSKLVQMFVVSSRLCLLGVALAIGQMPLQAELFLIAAPASTNAPPSAASLSVGWDPSPATDAAGYFLCYGFTSGVCTNRLDVGNVTSVTVGGVETNVTYYLAVVAYDGGGRESVPSNEIECAPLGASSVSQEPKLDLQLQGAGSNGGILRLSFQGNAGLTYQIQATEDLLQWVTVLTTNCVADGLINYENTDMVNYPRRFYRLSRQ
jgi:hypothetical protein